MKNLLILIFLTPMTFFGQITVTDSNLPNIGDSVITARDNTIFFPPGNSGVNQYWDFTNANGSIENILGFIDPSTTPYQSSFPTSNICVKIDSGSYYYLNRSFNGLSYIGIIDSGIVYQWENMILPTPLNYQDTISYDTQIYSWDTSLTPAIPAFFVIGMTGPYVVDSIKIMYGENIKYIVDGWGKIALPNGIYDALRVSETVTGYDYEAYRVTDTITNISQWIQGNVNSSWMGSKYSWRTNDSTVKWSLAEIETDSTGSAGWGISYYLGNSISSLNISPAIVNIDTIINLTCAGSSDGKIILDVIGTANPLIFFWIGPNGYTANTQDIYNLEAGNYTVNVTDANGNITTETIIVNEPPALLTGQTQGPLNILTCSASGGTPPYSYLWSNGNVTPQIYINTNGTYSCEVIDANGCLSTSSINITNLSTSISELESKKELIKITNILGENSSIINNKLLLYHFSDGTIEKRIIIK